MEDGDNGHEDMPLDVRIALSSGDARKLYDACKEKGYILSDNYFWELYEQGRFEAEQDEMRYSGLESYVINDARSGRKREVKVGRKNRSKNYFNYILFLEEIKGRGINVEDLSADSSSKKEVLRKYFARFRKGGKQDLDARNYSDASLGRIFRQVRIYGESVRGQNDDDASKSG